MITYRCIYLYASCGSLVIFFLAMPLIITDSTTRCVGAKVCRCIMTLVYNKSRPLYMDMYEEKSKDFIASFLFLFVQ